MDLRTQPAEIDPRVYGKLLSKVLPRVPRTEQENERAIAELERLDSLGRPEDRHYSFAKPLPLDALRFLMEQHNLRQRDLIPVFGVSSTVSTVLAGKRATSKAQARKLAGFFHAAPDLFI